MGMYVVFIFRFVIVLMNFLNAIAIGDINKLRENTIAESNIHKIENLLDQEPDIQDTYLFQNVNKPPDLQCEKIRLFTNKGYFGQSSSSDSADPHGLLGNGMFFLCARTIEALKSYKKEDLEERMRKNSEMMKRVLTQMQSFSKGGPSTPFEGPSTMSTISERLKTECINIEDVHRSRTVVKRLKAQVSDASDPDPEQIS